MLHQIVCSKRLLRWNLMITKLKERKEKRKYETTTLDSSSNICYIKCNKRCLIYYFSIQAMTPTWSASATTCVATTATVAPTMNKFATVVAAVAVPAMVCVEMVSD